MINRSGDSEKHFAKKSNQNWKLKVARKNIIEMTFYSPKKSQHVGFIFWHLKPLLTRGDLDIEIGKNSGRICIKFCRLPEVAQRLYTEYKKVENRYILSMLESYSKQPQGKYYYVVNDL